MQDTSYTRCIEISAQTLLIAVPDGRCWLTDLALSQVSALPVSALAAERGSLAGSLVEGAVCVGLTSIRPLIPSGPYTLPRYIRWLAGNYAFAGQTPGLFRLGARRFRAGGRHDLAEFALQKAAEETGHADLAYRDIEALGLPAGEVIRLVQPPSAIAFADRFRSYIESHDPVALFGFSYCLERMAVERDAAFIRNVEKICPPGPEASRFLKVHSNTGSDGGHVLEQLAMFESFEEAELTAVVRAVYETGEMLASQSEMDQALSDDEIIRRLRLEDIELSPARDTGADQQAITGESETPRSDPAGVTV